MPAERSPHPVKLKKEGADRLTIEWSDGLRSSHTWQQLRKHCPCATCREELQRPPDPFRLLSASELAAGPLQPVAMTPVGHYAYKITWNDGHDTGIYTFPALRALAATGEKSTTTQE